MIFFYLIILTVLEIVSTSGSFSWPTNDFPEMDGFPVDSCMNGASSVTEAATTSWATTPATTATLIRLTAKPFSKKSNFRQVAHTSRNSKNTTPGTILPAGPISNTVNYEETVRLIKLLLANFGKPNLDPVPVGVQPPKRPNRARLRAKLGSSSSESSEES